MKNSCKKNLFGVVLFSSVICLGTSSLATPSSKQFHKKILTTSLNILRLHLVHNYKSDKNSVTIAARILDNLVKNKDNIESLEQLAKEASETYKSMHLNDKNQYSKSTGDFRDLIQSTINSNYLYSEDHPIDGHVYDYLDKFNSDKSMLCHVLGFKGMAGVLIAAVKTGVAIGYCTSLQGKVYPIMGEQLGINLFCQGGWGLGGVISIDGDLGFYLDERKIIDISISETGDMARFIGASCLLNDSHLHRETWEDQIRGKGKFNGISFGIGTFHFTDVTTIMHQITPGLPVNAYGYAYEVLGLQ